ncbi:ATP-binding protein [Streptomyces telluris]|uniref:AAA family ATPase n=1 Tax=Streptomyces telluris TaxID=2720021 RepID=A0A9X2LGZ6_9ACTN|nr:LuxR family transcriptional regulator [Streptomyces telluris]MCQ8770978.1 AAA family ATPase [Streptomyces telluris]
MIINAWDGPRAGLLERQAEITGIERKLDDLSDGIGGILAVEGAAGTGKSSLLHLLQAKAVDRKFLVLHARGNEFEASFALGAVAQLVESADDDTPPAGPHGSRIAHLLHGKLPDEAHAAGWHPLLYELHRILLDLAGDRRLVIVIDDAQWADLPSLRFLSYLAARVAGSHMVLAVAVEPCGPGPAADLLGAVVTSFESTVLRPAPLSLHALEQVCAETLGGPDPAALAETLFEATHGNPMLVRAVLDEAATGPGSPDGPGSPTEPGHHADPTSLASPPSPAIPAGTSLDRLSEHAPRSLVRWVVRKLRSLPDPSFELAQTVALLGRVTDPRIVEDIACLSPAGAEKALAALIDAEILVDGPVLRFAQPLIRMAVQHSTPLLTRGRLHARAARALAAVGAPPEQVAGHLLKAPPQGDRRAVRSLLDAAASATGRCEPDAVRYLRRALREPPAGHDLPAVLSRLGAAELSVDHEEAAVHLREALEHTTDPDARSAVARDLAWALALGSRFEEAVTVLADTIVELDEADAVAHLDDALSCIARLSPGARDLRRHHLTGIRRHLDRIRERATGPSTDGFVGDALLDLLRNGTDAAQVADLAADTLRRAEPAAEHGVGWGAALTAAWSLVVCDRLPEARRAARALGDASRRRGVNLFHLDQCLQAYVELQLGQVSAAAQLAAGALEAGEPEGSPSAVQPVAVAALVEALIEQGDLEPAGAALSARELLDAEGDTFAHLFLLRARGRLRLELGHPGEGLADLLKGRRLDAELGLAAEAVGAWAPVITALHASGRAEDARALGEEELARAHAFGAARPLAVVLRTLAPVVPADRGLRLLEEAVDVLDGSSALLERAHTLYTYGSVLLRAGKTSAAREQLHLAAELAGDCEAYAVHRRACEELRSLDAPPRGPGRRKRSPSALTPAERRVADLAARGLSNRDIAQALFVTVKTVEWHLTQAYRKLRVTSRENLPRALDAATPEGS